MCLVVVVTYTSIRFVMSFAINALIFRKQSFQGITPTGLKQRLKATVVSGKFVFYVLQWLTG